MTILLFALVAIGLVGLVIWEVAEYEIERLLDELEGK